MTMQKQFAAFLFALTCALPAMPALAQSRAGIAAIVNEDIITNSDVDARANLAIQGGRLRPDANVLKQLRSQALDALIEEQIRLSEAKKANIKIDDKEIDDGFAKLAAQNNLTADQFKQILNKQPGNLASLRHQIEAQIAWGQIVKRKLRPQVNVSDTEIDNYLAEQDKNKGKVEYEVADIFLPAHNPQEEASALKLAQEIITQMREKGQRFSVLARQFSQGSEASKGGLLGWVRQGTLDPELDKVLAVMPVNEASTPVKAADGYHVLFLKGKREIQSLAEQSRKVQIKQVFSPAPPQAPPQYVQQSFEQIKKWQAQAVDCTAMQNIIKANPSPLSKDLGMMQLSDLPPPVLAAVQNAPIGKIQEPLRAADGFLLLMVCGREDQVDNEAVRDAAANIIGSERLNRLQRRYFRDLKDAAYIDRKDS